MHKETEAVVVAAPCAGLAPKNVHIQTLSNADYHYNRLVHADCWPAQGTATTTADAIIVPNRLQ